MKTLYDIKHIHANDANTLLSLEHFTIFKHIHANHVNTLLPWEHFITFSMNVLKYYKVFSW